jgi:hypothetical protein
MIPAPQPNAATNETRACTFRSLAKSAAIELRYAAAYFARASLSAAAAQGQAVSAGDNASLATFQMNFVVEYIINSMNFSYI